MKPRSPLSRTHKAGAGSWCILLSVSTMGTIVLTKAKEGKIKKKQINKQKNPLTATSGVQLMYHLAVSEPWPSHYFLD